MKPDFGLEFCGQPGQKRLRPLLGTELGETRKKQNMKKYAYCDYSANAPNSPNIPNNPASKPTLSKKKT